MQQFTSWRRRGAIGAALTVAVTVIAPVAVGARAAHVDSAIVTGGSIDEAWVTGLEPGSAASLLAPGGSTISTTTVDRLGATLVRNLTPASGYRFTGTAANGSPTTTAPFTVTAPGPGPAGLYSSQPMHVGLNYLTMRDGVSVAATLRLPPGKTLADGPFPTVIEYSGYGTAAPGSLIDSLTGKPVANASLLPDSATVVGAFLAPELGFATVSLQMRGTGCSGGAFDLFGYPSDYDGYDAVEIVAHQGFSLHHKVGMVGISYSGISQFEVAGTTPPDLAAIAPLSPTDDLFSTGYPGGVYNNGFAASWIADRIHDALPADQGGQSWAKAEIATGDTTCAANQTLHLEAQSLASLVGPNLSRDPSLFDRRSPTVWATRVKVPVFVVGSLQDEQTGPQWANLIAALKADPTVYATIDNGLHIDSMGPATIGRWLEFLELYVAQRPTSDPAVRSAAGALGLLGPLVVGSSTGAKVSKIPALRFTSAKTLAAAVKAFAAGDPRVRILFNNGGGPLGPGSLGPTGELDATAWPPTTGTTTSFVLGAKGALVPSAKARPAGSAAFTPDPALRPSTDLPTGNPWAAQPPYQWTAVPPKAGLGFLTAPFATQTTIAGPASLNLLLSSSATDTDLQATVTEVRPDGQEVYVGSGVLRASARVLSPASTALHPVPTYLAADRRPLVPGQLTELRLPLDPIAHVFAKGTRLRVVLSAPGGDRASWQFATYATDSKVTDTVALGVLGSALVVNVVANKANLAEPGCGALRGEPCRSYVAEGNGG